MVIPPDFNILPPDQLEKKNIENIEKELAQQILFGLEVNEINNSKKEELSIMNKILFKSF